MIQSNLLDARKCSKCIILSNDGRTAQISPDSEEDGNVKTVLGTFAMERHKTEGEEGSAKKGKYLVVFQIDNIGSQCLAVGVQQVGGDLEKDSFEHRHGFQINCRNGDVFRLG